MNTRCPICQTDAMRDPAQLACDHAMCRECIMQYTVDRGGTSCPLCRQEICGGRVLHTLQNRPFTRGLEKRVQTDYGLWRSRSIVRSMKQPQSFRSLAHLIRELNALAGGDDAVRKVIADEFKNLYFNPVVLRVLVGLDVSLFDSVRILNDDEDFFVH